jgi:hypothetical protein
LVVFATACSGASDGGGGQSAKPPPPATPPASTPPGKPSVPLSLAGVQPHAVRTTGGTAMRLTGAGITGDTTIAVGGSPCAVTTRDPSGTAVSCTTSARAAPGWVDVVASNGSGSTSLPSAVYVWDYLDVPFDYGLESGHFVLHTSGGSLRLSAGPWGAHETPFTGHIYGDPKANWSGYYASSQSDMTLLSGPGPCGDYSTTCGLLEANISARVAMYVTPSDGFEITSVSRLADYPPDSYYGTQAKWEVAGALGEISIDFSHLRAVSPLLRQKLIAAGYADPETVPAGPSPTPGGPAPANLVTGAPILMKKGEPLAEPQIYAQPIAGHPGYFGAGAGVPGAQIEFFVRGLHGEDLPYYAFVTDVQKEAFRGALAADANDPASIRFGEDRAPTRTWLWRAECDLYASTVADGEDYADVFSDLGTWWESGGPGCVVGTSPCDEVFSIWPIRRSSAPYDASLYAPGVGYLVFDYRKGDPDQGTQIGRYGEILSPAAPDAKSGTLSIHWRAENDSVESWQGVAYNLDTGARVLKVRWGVRVATAGAIVVPALPTAADPCDGALLTCHGHVILPGLF